MPYRGLKAAGTATATLTFDNLRSIIYASNPESPQYDPSSAAYAEFPEAIRELTTLIRNSLADNADDLAIASTFPRHDAYLATQALLSLGPDRTSTTIALLFSKLDAGNLHNLNPDAVVYSVILLGSTGKDARCAVGNIGPLLWSANSAVRSAAAITLERITEADLVASQYEIEITPSFTANSVPADQPEGSVVAKARLWWKTNGSMVNWHPSYDLCDP